jgi:hypothetical protein
LIESNFQKKKRVLIKIKCRRRLALCRTIKMQKKSMKRMKREREREIERREMEKKQLMEKRRKGKPAHILGARRINNLQTDLRRP